MLILTVERSDEGNRVEANQLDVVEDSQDQPWRCCGTNCSDLTD